MRRAIYEDDVIKLLDKGWKLGVYPVASNIHALPSAQTEIIMCKECKHRPTRDEDGWIDFPTERCPCQCEDDYYYSWMPKDDWFCGNAERKENG